MLRAIIFDFNGVLLNDEPLHFASMRDAVAQLGIAVSQEEYWSEYLPLDDWNCLAAICAAHSYPITPEETERTLELKQQNYRRMLDGRFPVLPGAVRFVRAAAQKYPLAIASGARRAEIEIVLQQTGLRPFFRAVLAAEDFVRAKPHPESYLYALARLNECLSSAESTITPDECLVIEDSVGGVAGSRGAGMYCLGVANTYRAEQLAGAHAVLPSLDGLTVEWIEKLIQESP
jgi:beta-phosphoglucomutase